MKRETLKHPKTYDLAARLGTSRPEALGFLQLLWDYTADVAPRGNIGKWPNGAIARACDYPGDADQFVEALVEAGWLDRSDSHRLVIHDVHDHAEQWWKQKITKMGTDFVTSPPPKPKVSNVVNGSAAVAAAPNGSLTAVTTESGVSATAVRTAGELTPGSVTTPPRDQTKPNLTKPQTCDVRDANDTAEGRKSNPIDVVVDHYRSKYPRSKPGKTERRLITARLAEGYSAADLCEAIDGNAVDPHCNGQNDRGKKYHKITTIFRDASQVDHYRESLETHKPQRSDKPPDPAAKRDQFRYSIIKRAQTARVDWEWIDSAEFRKLPLDEFLAKGELRLKQSIAERSSVCA